MKLLIVGGESDPNTQRIVDQAHLRDLDYFFWDTDHPDCLNIAWDFNQPDLDLGENRLRPSAIFMRWNVFGGNADHNLAAFETIQAYTFAWPETRILNRRTITDINNKSFNLRLAIQSGFQIPNTLVMSNLSPLVTIPNPESQVAKPLNGGAHTVSVADLAADQNRLTSQPPQFIQEKLVGENLRLFSVGGQLSCFHLVTSELDYREDANVGVVQVEVPPELVEPTQRIVSSKGFDYCALDFRCRQGFEEPVFLEVNSFPMFVRFDDAGQNCIADSILDFFKI
ncbi:MAG: glutathione synthase/RimK-type ligase-like ATP-grasp enzyme [Mariniblastus sp.]|jgi:glutathione synthase/RimK-type ligase-like ATP-grasp enzyme